MAYIRTSIFDLFKIGPGPSSSHTIGPMKAAFDFLQSIIPLKINSPGLSIEVHLYGSLSATGKGHGTHRAVLAGLLAYLPDNIDPKIFNKFLENPEESYLINLGDNKINFSIKNIHFEKIKYNSPHPNTLVIKLLDGTNVVLEKEYYSVGGGFIIIKDQINVNSDDNKPIFEYSNFDELKAHLKTNKITLIDLLLVNESAISGLSKKEIYKGIDKLLDSMHKAVGRGLKQKGVLPGNIRLQRKAPALFKQAQSLSTSSDSFMIFLNAYCMAASEENAAGNIVVTAPTSGASGVIPGVSYLLKNHYHHDKQKLRDGMLVAASIGFIIKNNASISGAEMGCMGEIGSAAAMAAAMLSYCAGLSIEKIESAAEISIEHHLGMTCDPIGGYVQIPCIERNAMGAIKAYNAYLLASSGNADHQKISFDSVVKVMRATGKDMSKKYKETSEAGLALSMTEC